MRKVSGYQRNCFIVFCFIVVLSVFLGGCRPAAKEIEENTVTAEKLLEAYNPYIGDAAADGRLIGLAKEYFGVTQPGTMELQTSSVPYGLILHFEEAPDPVAIQKLSAVLMRLIGNCDSVSWDYPLDADGNREYFHMPYSAVQDLIGMDVKDDGPDKGTEADRAEAEHRFEEFLEQLETIDEPYPAGEPGSISEKE